MNAVVQLGDAFKAPAAAAFQGIDAGDDLSGGITGGYGLIRIRGKVWAIHYQGNDIQLMRPDGDGPVGSINIVILKANPHLSKTWYENGWDENSTNPPDCSSSNGVVPDAGVPKKQNNVCATCPRNQWGTAPNGGKGKACGDHRRLAVVPDGDFPNESFGGPLLLRCPAASLQDLAAFDGKYKQAGYPYFSMVVKVGFDPKESFPKLTFTAVRPLNNQEAEVIMALRNSDAVARVIADSAPVAPPAGDTQQVTFEQGGTNAPPAAAVTQQQTPVQPTTQVQQPVQPQPQPQQEPAPAAAAGFGGAVAAKPAQQAAQLAQRPAQTMTGFGGAAVAPAAQQAQQPTQQAVQQPAQQPVQAAPVSPAKVEAFEASLDDKLAALIGNGS